MAPTATATTGIGTPTAMLIDTAPTSDFDGEDFLNNLGTDLAPLLTLFGEQVTKQFLSMSLGWADNILLAMGPLGIITTIVAAIRVGNVKALKALIGRAREKLAMAEPELLSSTSDNTSELWTGDEIVRQSGKAPILELVLYQKTAGTQGATSSDIQMDILTEQPYRLGDLGDAHRDGALVSDELVRQSKLKTLLSYLDFGIRPATFDPKALAKQPSNLTLNTQGAMTSKKETRLLAAFGITVQCVAMIVPAFMTYHWKLQKRNKPVPTYAYPLFLVSSCLLYIGIGLCSHLIEATTVEQVFIPRKVNAVKKVFSLQMECTLGDQDFDPYIIMGLEDCSIRTSRSRSHTPNSDFVEEVQNTPAVDGEKTTETHEAVPHTVVAAQSPARALASTNASVTSNARNESSGFDLTESEVARSVTKGKNVSKKPTGKLPQVDLEPTLGTAMKDDTPSSLKESTNRDVPTTNQTRTRKIFTCIAVALSLGGFVGQFVGLRALHWSAAVAQLVVALLMTAVRARVRRGLSKRPKAIRLPDNDPNWIALSVGTACRYGWRDTRNSWPYTPASSFGLCCFYDMTSVFASISNPSSSKSDILSMLDPTITLRHKMRASTDQTFDEQANILSRVIKRTIYEVARVDHWRQLGVPEECYTWTHVVRSGRTNSEGEYTRFELSCSEESGHLIWKDGDGRLSALLALWTYSLDARNDRSRASHSLMTSLKMFYQTMEISQGQDDASHFYQLSQNWIQPMLEGSSRRKCLISHKDTSTSKAAMHILGLSFLADKLQGSYKGIDDIIIYHLVHINAPLNKQCAIEIFSGFVNAMARAMKEASASQPASLEKLSRLVDMISASLVAEGLVQEKLDAKLLVLPAFLRWGLLPLKPEKD